MYSETLSFQAMGNKGTYVRGYVEGMFKECKRLGTKLNFEYEVKAMTRSSMFGGSKVVGYVVEVKLSGHDKRMVTRLADLLAQCAN
jgi:hypothetical protein